MQFQQTPTQMRRAAPSMSEGMVAAASTPTTKEIPYDYVAKFALQGKRGNRVQDVINISVEGAFVAVAIGYSFIPALPPPQPLPEIPVTSGGGDDVISQPSSPRSTTLIQLIAERVTTVLRIPNGTDRPTTVNQLATLMQPFIDSRELMQCLQVRLCGINFKYSIVDSGSGRELQNQPIHNIAGLGESSGERPFRPFAKPMLFMPRSTIRIEVEEISVGPIYQGAELYIVLHGYKMLGYGTGSP